MSSTLNLATMTVKQMSPALIEASESFDTLTRAQQDELYRRVAELEAGLRARILTRPAVTTPDPDRAVGIDEACTLLGTKRPWLERRTNWKRLGGFKDHDGHVKFAYSTLQRHLKTQKEARLH